MLVLSRKVGESVQVGPEITVTIIEVGRGKVRIGFTAPRDVPIHRTELLRNGTPNPPQTPPPPQ